MTTPHRDDEQDPVVKPNDPADGYAADVEEESTTIRDVKQLGLFAAIASLSYVFWVVGAMEMVERLAYYGVRAVAGLYATASAEEGGLGITEQTLAWIFTFWALVQSFFPVFTGVLSDRYGYKESIFASTVIKIIGYLIMGFWATAWGFGVGAVVLALGTAIFKPGIQGTLVKSTTRKNSSMAWGIFYQTVNIGGWLGPLVASYLRSNYDWDWIFFACAGIIALNFLLLLTYREVGKQERLDREKAVRDGTGERRSMWADSLHELSKPHVAVYLLIFAGFWFMFMALFDVLPLHIRDWVDTTDVTDVLFGRSGTPNPFLKFIVGANEDGTAINPEGMLNLNAGLIMLTCFLFAAFSARFRATTSMVIGTLLASTAMFIIGWTTTGWVMLGAIACFSIGEMLSSPKFSEYIGNFAPADKKAMYLGFSQIPLAIGWTLESFLGPNLYYYLSSREQIARGRLVEQLGAGLAETPSEATFAAWSGVEGVKQSAAELQTLFTDEPAKFVEAIPKGEAFDWLVQITQTSPEMLATFPNELSEMGFATTQQVVEAATATKPAVMETVGYAAPECAKALTVYLHDAHNVGAMWYVMVAIGLISAIGIWWYGRWVLTLKTVR